MVKVKTLNNNKLNKRQMYFYLYFLHKYKYISHDKQPLSAYQNIIKIQIKYKYKDNKINKRRELFLVF